MRRTLMACLVSVALAGPALASGGGGSILVSPAWVAERLGDPSLVILHVAAIRDDYTRGHIPGARFVWLNWIAPPTPERSFEMPPVRTLRATLERLGVSNGNRIVVCQVLGDVTAAARAYVALEYLGMGDRTVILDGGFEAWKAEGRPVSREVPKYRPGRFAPRIREHVLVDLAQLRSTYRDPGVLLVDGRAAQAFNARESVSLIRGGHVPGAVSIPYSTLTDSLGRYLPPDTLTARFAAAGVKPGDRIVTYCGVGRSACPVYVTARLLGHSVSLYDGSFEEWSRQEDLPVENTGKK